MDNMNESSVFLGEKSVQLPVLDKVNPYARTLYESQKPTDVSMADLQRKENSSEQKNEKLVATLELP